MALLDYSKLRPDVAKHAKKAEKVIMMGGLKYMLSHPNFKAMKILKILEEEFDNFLKKGSMDLKNESFTTLDLKTKKYISKLIDAGFGSFVKKYHSKFIKAQNVRFEKVDVDGITAEWIIPQDAIEDHVFLHFHGGGFHIGSPSLYRGFNSRLANQSKRKILSIDYRLGPEHKFPAYLEDSVAAYKWLLNQGYAADKIILVGDSGGANMVLSTMLNLKQENQPISGGGISVSPFADWTFSGKSWYENAPTDSIVSGLPMTMFADGLFDLETVDLKNPLISPIFADYKNVAPLLIITSTCEMCYDDAKRVADKAKKGGVDVQFEEWDDMPHIFPAFGVSTDWPEVGEAFTKMVDFVKKLQS